MENDELQVTCPACGAVHPASDQYCSGCGHDRLLDLQIAAFQGPALDTARKWILGIGFLYLLGAFMQWVMSGEHMTDQMLQVLWGSAVGLFLIHGGLWWWARTAPFPAAVVALVLFLTLQLASGMIDPSTMLSGLVIKLVILVVLVRAVDAGYKAHKLRQSRGRRAAP